jgi:hypothetical protein
MDYGTIRIVLHPNLSHDQRFTLVNTSVHNQLFTATREHYNEILYQCQELSKLVYDTPVTISWNYIHYKYKIIFDIFD